MTLIVSDNKTQDLLKTICDKLDILIEMNKPITVKADVTDEDYSDYTQISYIADGTTSVFYGKNCLVEFNFPPSVLTAITIKERKQKEEK